MPSRYQYQPVTGPVWREPVAAGLSWLPAGRPVQPRGLPAVALAALAASFFVAVQPPAYDPQDLAWQPRNAVVARALPASPQSLSVLSPFPLPPAGYDAAGLQWLPAGRGQPARGLPSAPWNDATTAGVPVYDPQELQWIPVTAWPLRTLPATRTGSTALDPFPRPPVAFDPALFPWTEARSPRAPVERRILGESVAPFTAALYQPEFLQWLPPDWSRLARALPRAGQTWDTLSPFPIAPPPFDPAHLAWVPSGRAPLRLGEPVRTGSAVLDPLPLPGAAPAPTPSPTEPPGGGKRRRHPVEHVVRLEPKRPRGRPTTPEPAMATPVEVAPAPATQAAPAPAGPFTFEVPAGAPPAEVPPLPAPSAEGIALAGLAPDLAAVDAIVAQSAEDRLRLLLFAAVTLT